MSVNTPKSRSWQSKSGRREPTLRPFTREQLEQDLRNAERAPRRAPSVLTITRIAKGGRA